jgi:hypothetical protein
MEKVKTTIMMWYKIKFAVLHVVCPIPFKIAAKPLKHPRSPGYSLLALIE